LEQGFPYGYASYIEFCSVSQDETSHLSNIFTLTIIPYRCLATSTYTPAIPYVQEHFNVSRELAIVPLSIYALGMGVGPLLAAPLSELYGRRIVYFVSMPLFLAFEAGAGAAQNIQTLIVCRFLASALGTAPLAIGAGSISDVWVLEKDGGFAGMLFILAPFLGPCLGE
jgi:MFS family permease